MIKPSLYLAYKVRGKDGDAVDRGILQDNLEYGRLLGQKLRAALPECAIYVPHDKQNEDVIQAAWYNDDPNHQCGSEKILAHSADIVRVCTGGLLACCDVRESEGVELEVAVAKAVGIPVFDLWSFLTDKGATHEEIMVSQSVIRKQLGSRTNNRDRNTCTYG